MSGFIQGFGAVIIGVFLALILGKQSSESAMLVSIGVCVFVGFLAFEFLSPVISFLQKLGELSGLDDDILSILFKTVGIGLLAELGSHICTDAGNASLGRSLQLLAAGGILWVSIPLLESLLDMIRLLLGEL